MMIALRRTARYHRGRNLGVPAPVLVAIWGLELGEFGAGLRYLSDFQHARHARFRLPALLPFSRRTDRRAEAAPAWGDNDQRSICLGWRDGPDPIHALSLSAATRWPITAAVTPTWIGNSGDALASAANFLKSRGWVRGAGYHEGEPNYQVLLGMGNAAPSTPEPSPFSPTGWR